ncbi:MULTISPECIES: STAS domain-containing protein [unclassified Variovorax]|uniref:STAS domain-containing protein n=1 Tax=unclassified Variovorax TaxID=663243 RepID=UPI001BD30524|nr:MULTISPECIES: STAS domain-containing protein [unclassified Variovorax]
MAKEEPGRLLSKVAKFVRNPLKDWAELDEQDAGSSDTGYSREMLKEMIERRQRNDFVRRREFDMLRKLRQREASGSREATPSSFSISSTTGKTAGRALTLKKIDEIEEQMSQQWWKNRQQGSNGEPMTPAAMAAQQARAYADTEPGQAPPVAGDAASGESHLPRPPGIDSGLEEAAIRFAHGDDPGAEAILLQTLAPEAPQADNVEIWRALLDFYRATGDFDKFSQTSMRYAQRFKKPGPEWISLRALAREVQVAGAAELDSRGAGGPDGADWSCPEQLTRGGLAGLTQALSGAGPVWTLEWHNLAGIHAEAAGPLRALMEHWAASPVQLRFAGAEQLLAVLAAATPTNNRNTEPVWWQLRMAILRVMNDVDGFELTALNYCITYEVSPPPWEDPAGSYAAADLAAAPQPKPSGMSLASMRMGLGTSVEPAPAPAVAGHRLLVGELTGECHDVLHELDAELVDAQVPTVSCAALVRMDFAAAGTLLNWAMARAARGQRVEFVDVQRMLAAFFKVIGIADHASVAVRSN